MTIFSKTMKLLYNNIPFLFECFLTNRTPIGTEKHCNQLLFFLQMGSLMLVCAQNSNSVVNNSLLFYSFESHKHPLKKYIRKHYIQP